MRVSSSDPAKNPAAAPVEVSADAERRVLNAVGARRLPDEHAAGRPAGRSGTAAGSCRRRSPPRDTRCPWRSASYPLIGWLPRRGLRPSAPSSKSAATRTPVGVDAEEVVHVDVAVLAFAASFGHERSTAVRPPVPVLVVTPARLALEPGLDRERATRRAWTVAGPKRDVVAATCRSGAARRSRAPAPTRSPSRPRPRPAESPARSDTSVPLGTPGSVGGRRPGSLVEAPAADQVGPPPAAARPSCRRSPPGCARRSRCALRRSAL